MDKYFFPMSRGCVSPRLGQLVQVLRGHWTSVRAVLGSTDLRKTLSSRVCSEYCELKAAAPRELFAS
ncbi:hypothetical protein CRG98_014849 [Punica granatum]|uniref:Uncharacterized protein n=1 Tax=Punica granatum TaxID=22663 RepID=A0A2I0K9C7_PUNGR|nr:hypothetical protein CRG98_014849 [Punica granatum]